VKFVVAKSASPENVREPMPMAGRVGTVRAADPVAGPAPETIAEKATTPADARAAARIMADRRR